MHGLLPASSVCVALRTEILAQSAILPRAAGAVWDLAKATQNANSFAHINKSMAFRSSLSKQPLKPPILMYSYHGG